MSVGNAVRIVVTGTGLIGPLGCGTQVAWSRLLAGQSGIRALPEDLAEGTGCSIAGRVPSVAEDSEAGYDPERYIAAKDRKKMDRFIEFALVAAQEALGQAGWHPADLATQLYSRAHVVLCAHVAHTRHHYQLRMITPQKH